MDISWKNIDSLEDYQITYLLYRESLTVNQIERVRNISSREINDHIIKAKLEEREKNRAVSDTSQKDELENYLELGKDERLSFLNRLKDEKMLYFKRKVYKRILTERNTDDLIALIWTAGELRDAGFLKVLHTLTKNNNSDVRRISYSAIRKIGSPESREVLEMGLYDSNPQTRQYCAKALLKVGNNRSLNILRNQYKAKRNSEKDYVLRAYLEAIIELEKSE